MNKKKRKLYTRLREKKFRYLRNTGRLANYYFQKRQLNKRDKVLIQPKEVAKLNWFEKAFIATKSLFRTIRADKRTEFLNDN